MLPLSNLMPLREGTIVLQKGQTQGIPIDDLSLYLGNGKFELVASNYTDPTKGICVWRYDEDPDYQDLPTQSIDPKNLMLFTHYKYITRKFIDLLKGA